MTSDRSLPFRFRPQLEKLEVRTVPATTLAIFEATGVNAAAIQATVDSFRTALGTDHGAQVGSFGTGRRQVNWDGAPDAVSAPLLFPPEFFNVQSPRGVVFTTPGSGFQVSMDNDAPADADPDQVEFDNINATYSTSFGAFSAQRLFTAIGSNVTEVSFYVPGTVIPALVRGFGAVFTDVDLAGSTKLEFFDAAGNLLLTRAALATAGNASLSFVGAAFDGAAPIARVRITSGNVPLGTDDDPANNRDVVAMDDFIYSEPVAATLVAQDSGGQPLLHFIDPTSGARMGGFAALPPGNTAGVRIATGDVNGDNITDFIIGAGKGAANEVIIYNGQNLAELARFTPYEAGFQGGVFVAAGNFDGDAQLEVVTSPGAGRNVEIRVWNVAAGTGTPIAGPLGNLLAYGSKFKGGAQVAAGDVTNTGVGDEIVVSPGKGSAQPVKIFRDNGTAFRSFKPFGKTYKNGINLAVGDLDGDTFADLAVSRAKGNAQVRLFSGPTGLSLGRVTSFTTTKGVRLGLADVNGDGDLELLTASGPGQTARVRIIDAQTLETLSDFLVVDALFTGGLFIGGVRVRA